VAANPESIDHSRRAAAALRALLALIKQYKRISRLAPSHPRDTLFTLWRREMAELLSDFSTLLSDIASPAPFPRNETMATTAALYAADHNLPLTDRQRALLEPYGYLERRERELPKTSNNEGFVVPTSVGQPHPPTDQLLKTSNNDMDCEGLPSLCPAPNPRALAQLPKTSNNAPSPWESFSEASQLPAQLPKTSNKESSSSNSSFCIQHSSFSSQLPKTSNKAAPLPTSPIPRSLPGGYRPKKSKRRRH
jgi:hypothetical protein